VVDRRHAGSDERSQPPGVGEGGELALAGLARPPDDDVDNACLDALLVGDTA
jgi:hypothetical protein